jgi:hypothetical protein
MTLTRRSLARDERGEASGNVVHADERSRNKPSPHQDQARCRQCGAELPQRRKLKQFCSYACRGRFRALAATMHQTGLVGSKNAKQIKALQRLKRLSVGRFAFSPINQVTWHIDAPNKLGVAWVIDVGSTAGVSSVWFARCRNMMHGPHPFSEAKAAALAMAKSEERGDVVLDPIGLLNRLQAELIELNRGDE